MPLGPADDGQQAPPDRPLAAAVAASGAYSAPDTPRRMIPGDEHVVKVTVTNTTSSTLVKARYVLSYHWELPDGSDATTSSNRLETELPADLAPGAAVTLDAKAKAPTLADIGNEREKFVLRWDFYNRTDRTWLSRTANVPTLDQNVTVEQPTSDQLGLEKFYQYGPTATGAGSNLLVNQFSGNAVWSYDALSNPSRGLATFLRMTYNSKDTSTANAGAGWSLAPSTVHRLGTPLQFGGLLPGLLGWPETVTLTDGDGTSHVFELDRHGSLDTSKWTYDSPAGVHVYLQKTDLAADRRWVMTGPDRTRMYFDDQGYQTATVERNGGELQFTYERALIGNRNTGVLKSITDPAGRRTLTLDYYRRGDAFSYFLGDQKLTGTALDNLLIVDQLKSVTDVSGRVLTFTYSDRGLLREVVDGAGTPDAKTFGFFYDQAQGDRNAKLVKVVDPNGHGTSINYYTDANDALRKWNARTVTDRRTATNGFDYTDPDGDRGSKIQSTATDGNGHTTTYLIDGFGRPEKLTNAKREVTELHWDEDNNVVKLVENNKATTTWVFDQKTGNPLEIRDAEANAHGTPPTKLGYRTELDGHVADLTEKITPEGRKWTFVYDAKGNLVAVTDPKGTASPDPNDYTSRYRYDELGHLIDQTDANGHTTVYGDYDPNGYPRRITDPLNCSTFYRYDSVGNVVSTTDAKARTSTFTFDVFKRPLDSKQPKDQAAGKFIITPGPRYDRNDNVVTSTDANGAVTTMAYDERDQQVAVTAPKDTPSSPAKTSTFVYDNVGNLIRKTEPKGTLTSANPDDFTSTYKYDEVDQKVEATDARGQRITAFYDDVGNLVKRVDARKNASPDPNDYTTKYVFDGNHQVLETIDATGKSAKSRYDRDGNVVASTDEDGNETLITLDERAMQSQVRSPHSVDNGTIRYFTTAYEYDQVGNQTRTINPRGFDTGDDQNDFVHETVYDELNRVREEVLPFDKDDPEVTGRDSTIYSYDEVGRMTEVSAPPSHGESVRNNTRYTYFDNGWTRTSTDAWDIRTSYDYTALGQQANRTVTSAGGGATRVQTWDYYPDGKLKSRSDGGVPVGRNVVVVDNANASRTQAVGAWATAESDKGFQGSQYRVHDAGNGSQPFSWKAPIPADGDYDVLVRYPEATATDATYTVEHNGGASTVQVDQTKRAGEWVSLGRFAFAAGQVRSISLSDKANGKVAADAVQLVRDNSADVDAENKTFTHFYDANDNLTKLTDSTPATEIDTYDVTYDEVNRPSKVEERNGGAVKHTTRYGYDENDNLKLAEVDEKSSAYEYDVRDLVSRVTNKKSASDPKPKVHTFEYTGRGHLLHQVKGNGNTVDYDYYLDGLLKHQVEHKKGGSEVVNEHSLEYDSNSNRTKDTSKKQSGDGGGQVDGTTTYTYDPRDRVRKVTKKSSTEDYKHDANGNVFEQTVGGTKTTFDYDRNRLVSSNAGGRESTYDYDAFGRLSKVSSSGLQLEKYTYDGFDRKTEYVKGDGAAAKKTTYTYDPLDRTVTEATGGKTTRRHYLGLSEQVLTEDVDGKLRKAYQYSADGELLSQVSFKDDGSEEDSYYGFNPHSDVEQTTDDSGASTSTYGYTAYGKNDDQEFTGADKPDPANPDKEQQNVYRFNTARWDQASGSYDMGFRDYNPEQNRFLTVDLYNNALSDLSLTTNPFTNNRYAFAGGNPLSQVELDGHGWFDDAADWVKDNAKDIGHAALDVAGLVPVIGEAADLANAAWYTAEGDYANAALSAASAIPFAGYAASAVKAGKYAVKGADAVQGATKAAKAADSAKTASKAADAGTNGAKSAPAPKPAPKTGSPAAKGGGGSGGGAKAGSKSGGAKDSGGGTGGGKAANGGGTSAGKSCNSFTPETPVLMADGSHMAIGDVRVGDTVLATDPGTGRTEAKPVTALITGEGEKRLVEVRVDTDGAVGEASGVVVATDGHPFWVEEEGRWVAAADLHAGESVRSAAGERLRLLAVRVWSQRQVVYNLTVAGIHTYYVTAGGTDILVHNAGGSSCGTGGADYSRPSKFRAGIRDKTWENAREGATGQVRDPKTGRFMNKDQPWDMGHIRGHEFRKHQKSAAQRGISRKQFLDEFNNPDDFHPELPSSNQGHSMEDMSDNYEGP